MAASSRPVSPPALSSVELPAVPRDLVLQVATLAGFTVAYTAAGTPMYKTGVETLPGEESGKLYRHEVEAEFDLPRVAMKIMAGAPQLDLQRTAAGYICGLKQGAEPKTGASLVEAVFRAFVHAKAVT